MKHREDKLSGSGAGMSAANASPFTADADEEDPEVLYDKVGRFLRLVEARVQL